MSRDRVPTAFPVRDVTPLPTYLDEGMSLRDWFAGQALPGLIASSDGKIDVNQEPVGINRARWAYALADAMMKAREE